MQLCARVLAEHEPLDALRVWFLRLADHVRLKHGLGEALHTVAAQDVINETYAPVTAAVGQLLDAAEQAGQVRPGLDPADVLVMGFLWRVAPGESGRRQAERILDMVIENLRVKTYQRVGPLTRPRATPRTRPLTCSNEPHNAPTTRSMTSRSRSFPVTH
jgi:hypothetical protein